MKATIAIFPLMITLAACDDEGNDFELYEPSHVELTDASYDRLEQSELLNTVVLPYFDNLAAIGVGLRDDAGAVVPNQEAEDAWFDLWNLDQGRIFGAYPVEIPGLTFDIEGKEGLEAFVAQTRGAFGKWQFVNADVFAAEDGETFFMVCDGDMESATPTPIPYQNRYTFVMRVEDGKVIEIEEYFNPETFRAFLEELRAQLEPSE